MQDIKPTTIDEYITQFPTSTQEYLQQIRAMIKNLAPDAEERISYGIPAFNLNEKYLIYFAGYKKHVSIYPAPRGNEAFEKELAKYKGGKGTVQFPLNNPLPEELITRIVRFRIEENKSL